MQFINGLKHTYTSSCVCMCMTRYDPGGRKKNGMTGDLHVHCAERDELTVELSENMQNNKKI